MKRKRASAFALIATAAIALSGCSAPNALEAGTQMCEDSLQYEIEQVVPEPDAGWVGSDVTSKATSHHSPDDSQYVYEVHGTAQVTLSDETTVDVDWECFTQTVEGTTYASVTRINGECSKTHKEALEKAGKPGCS